MLYRAPSLKCVLLSNILTAMQLAVALPNIDAVVPLVGIIFEKFDKVLTLFENRQPNILIADTAINRERKGIHNVQYLSDLIGVKISSVLGKDSHIRYHSFLI